MRDPAPTSPWPTFYLPSPSGRMRKKAREGHALTPFSLYITMVTSLWLRPCLSFSMALEVLSGSHTFRPCADLFRYGPMKSAAAQSTIELKATKRGSAGRPQMKRFIFRIFENSLSQFLRVRAKKRKTLNFC